MSGLTDRVLLLQARTTAPYVSRRSRTSRSGRSHAAAPGIEEGFRVGPLPVGETMILRPRTSMRLPRWNSLITLETASLVEATMFARSWCVSGGSRPCPTLRARRSGRPGAAAARQAASPRPCSGEFRSSRRTVSGARRRRTTALWRTPVAPDGLPEDRPAHHGHP